MILGIDIGTSTISIVLCRPDGVVERVWNLKNDSKLPDQLHPYLQDPAWICEQVQSHFQRISKEYSIERVGITCQMHGILYVDAKGQAVSPLYTWEDESGLEIAPSGRCYLDELNALAGTQLTRGIAFGCLTHFYLTRNNGIPQQAVCFCGIGDYIAMRLCGNTKPMVHISMAASFGLFDLRAQDFDRNAVHRAGLDARWFPKVIRGSQCVGHAPNGAAVSAAIGDNQASFLGSVRDWDSEILLNLGTGGQISCYSHEIVERDGIETRPLLDGDYLNVYTSHCGGRAYAALERFYRDVLEMAGMHSNSLYAAMEASAARLEDQPRDAVRVTPAFCGSRVDPLARCEISNLTLDNFNPAALSLGFMEGICQELYPFYQRCLTTHSFRQITGSGNTIRRNSVMQRIIERVFGLPLRLTDSPEEAAIGAVRYASQMHL